MTYPVNLAKADQYHSEAVRESTLRSYVLTYGSYAGLTIAVLLAGSVYFAGGQPIMNVAVGYAMMALALVFLLVGMKRYRDDRGGSFGYLEGMLVGAGIAAVASVFYTATWELCLYLTDYSFMSHYIEMELKAAQQSGQTPLELERLEMELRAMSDWYRNFFFRAGVTFMEMFPVGALISIVAAFILKNPKVLPRTTAD